MRSKILVEIANEKIYRPLQVFGTAMPVNLDNNKGPDSENEEIGALYSPGTREKMMGKFLPTLQDLSNFIDRCYTVATNMVQQLSSLLRAREGLYKTTFNNVHLVPAFAASLIC